MNRVPIIFDNDAGSDIDDLWALALALKHPNIDLRGVTTVAGDTQMRARIVAKMLRMAGRPDVPVAAGPGEPLVTVERGAPGGPQPKLTHAGLVHDDDPEAECDYPDAIELILDALARAETPITLVATGAWTNIALVLQRADARQRANIAAIALMGGEVHWMLAESNVRNDPEAAEVVLHAGVPTFVGTWSVTRRLEFPMAEVASLLGPATSPMLQMLHEGTRLWWGEGRGVKPGPVCYDVVPVFWAAGQRDAISCIRLPPPPVELVGTHTRGMMPVHPWTRLAAETSNEMSADRLTVTDTMDAAALKRRYVELVVA